MTTPKMKKLFITGQNFPEYSLANLAHNFRYPLKEDGSPDLSIFQVLGPIAEEIAKYTDNRAYWLDIILYLLCSIETHASNVKISEEPDSNNDDHTTPDLPIPEDDLSIGAFAYPLDLDWMYLKERIHYRIATGHWFGFYGTPSDHFNTIVHSLMTVDEYYKRNQDQ